MIINSLKNEKIKLLKKLHQKKHRQPQKQYLFYGDNLCDLVNHDNCNLILTSKVDYINSEVEVVYVSQDVIDYLTLEKSKNEFVFVLPMAKFSAPKTSKVVVLENIQDPGNLGTIIRTCHALGISDLVLSLNTVDPYNPKVVAAAQGSLLAMNICICDLDEYLTTSNLPLITTYLDEEHTHKKQGLDEFNLCFGNEGVGLDKKHKILKHKNYKIKTYSESLNVAIASGIIIFDLQKGD